MMCAFLRIAQNSNKLVWMLFSFSHSGEVIGAICLPDPLSKTDTNRVTVMKSNDGDYILNGM